MRAPLRAALLPILLLLATAGLARSADVEIVVPANVPAYKLVDVSTPADGTGFAWFILGPDRGFADWRPVAANKSAIVFTGPPGQYTIMLVVARADGTLDQANAVVTIGENPVPPPPPPPPPPTPGKRFVLVVAESKIRTANQAAVLHALHKYADTKGHSFSPRDKDETDARGNALPWLVKYREKIQAAGVSLPAMVVIEGEDGSGDVLAIKPLPDDPDSALKIIQETGG
jgi:hypothetical protein